MKKWGAVLSLLVGAEALAYLPGPRILAMRGIVRAGSHSVVSGETVAVGKTLQTSPDGFVLLHYIDGVEVMVGKNSKYRVIEQAENSETTWAELSEGEARIHVPERLGPPRRDQYRRFILRLRHHLVAISDPQEAVVEVSSARVEVISGVTELARQPIDLEKHRSQVLKAGDSAQLGSKGGTP